MTEHPRSTQLAEDLQRLIETLDRPPVAIWRLSTRHGRPEEEGAFRIERQGAGRLKAVVFSSAARAAHVAGDLERLAHPHFPQALAREGRALLFPWVEGTPVDACEPSAPLVRRCAALQVSLHGQSPAGRDADDAIADRLSRLDRELGELRAAGLIAPGAARHAVALAARAAPPPGGDVGLIHWDFCADNLVRCADGTVVAVDNENVRIEAADFDLARTWYRWPMTPALRRAYLDAYAAHRDVTPFLDRFPYWAVVTLVRAARFRLRGGGGSEAVPLQRLAALLGAADRGREGRQLVFEA